LTLDSTGRRMRYCFPLTGLKVLRTESCLQLCRVNRQDGQLDLWANLRFTLYESMLAELKRSLYEANACRNGTLLLHPGGTQTSGRHPSSVRPR